MNVRLHRMVARVGVATCLAVGLLAAGCGVPDHSDVRVDGPPAEAGSTGSGGQPDPPPGPEEARSEEELVEFFLQAAATDPDNPAEVLREFLHPDIQDGWQPELRIYVARIGDEQVVTPGDTTRFDLTVRRVGALSPNGIVEPLTRQEEQVGFSVSAEPIAGDDVRVSGVRYYLVEVPPLILLDDAALERHFDWRPVYFWDTGQGTLVPDLRWLRRAVPEAQRPQIMVDWLVAGPAPGLSGTVTAVPEGVERVGNVVWGEDRSSLEVRLAAPPEGVDLRALDAQLWWTLRPDIAGIEATVVVNGEERQLGDSYRAVNAVPAQTPPSFAMLDGEIWQYVPAEQVPLPALPDELGPGIQRAAVTRDGRDAALVRQEPTGELRLALAESQEVTGTDLVAQSIGQPVWLNNPSGTGLVVADGALRQFRSGQTTVDTVELTDLAGAVTAVAAAPDGRRLALVAGGRLYVVSVARAGEQISVSTPPRPLPTTATDLEGVAFLREEWLAIVGTARGQSQLFELTVDGALEREFPDGGLGTPEIGSFVAYPGDPTDPDDRGTIMYEADELAWWYSHPQEPVRITAAQLRGEEQPDPDAGAAEPRAPFFLD